MFYSQSLLSKKGVLGTIWVAAHCLKRLKKEQVSHTNISSSVDKILADEVPFVTHRVLAFLLLGLVKIYSRKVEYLYDDCNRVVDRINDFAGIKKKATKSIQGFHAPRVSLSITRPKAMELDAFDLQIFGDGNGDNARASEDIPLEGTSKGTGYYSPEKNRCEADVSHSELFSTQHTPVNDVISPYPMEKDIGPSSLSLVYSESSIENLRANGFSLEDRLDPMVLGDTKADQDLFEPMFDNNESNEKHMKLSQKQDESYLEERYELRSKRKDRLVPMKVDVNFQSKDPHDSGGAPPELIGVQTPVIRERGSFPRKRKCLFDEVVVLSNRVVKDSLNDTSSLVCKRRKAPHTPLHAWKRNQLSNPRIFSEPLFSGNSSELRYLFSETKLKSKELVDDVDYAEAPEKLNMTESPTWHKSPDGAHIAPTPVTQSASLISHHDVETVKFDRGGHPSTIERLDEELSSSEEEDSERSLTNEEVNSQGDVTQERDGWSDRTRLVAKQLSRSFQSRKTRGQNKGVSLSRILKKKTKNESARFFYETLVLESRGYIDVEQNEAYGDILVLETLKLKQAFECGEFDVGS